MRNHDDMQNDVVKSVYHLMDDINQVGDTFGLPKCQRKLRNAGRLFRHDPGAYNLLKEIAEGAATFRD
jgi:hypothetical protein